MRTPLGHEYRSRRRRKDIPFTGIIFWFKEIQEMKFYPRTCFGWSKGSYYCTIIHPFQYLGQGSRGSLSGWFPIRCILIIYFKDKVPRVEIKTEITGNDFNLATVMFVDNRYFPTLYKITDSQWNEVLQPHQITVCCYTTFILSIIILSCYFSSSSKSVFLSVLCFYTHPIYLLLFIAHKITLNCAYQLI